MPQDKPILDYLKLTSRLKPIPLGKSRVRSGCLLHRFAPVLYNLPTFPENTAFLIEIVLVVGVFIDHHEPLSLYCTGFHAGDRNAPTTSGR